MSYAKAVRANLPPNFPAAWLIPADDKYVIDRGYWNDKLPPENLRKNFTVNWDNFSGSRIKRMHFFGVELAGLVVRFYFGITGCIIPLGGFLDWHEDVVAFTFARLCDFDGRKEFYMFCYSPALCETRLARSDRGFASVADFQQNLTATKYTSVEPVAGGKEALVDRYKRFGIPIRPY